MYHGMTGIAAEQFARSQITPSTSCYRAYARVNTSARCSRSLSLAIVSVKKNVMPPPSPSIPNENIIFDSTCLLWRVVHRVPDNEIKRARRDGRSRLWNFFFFFLRLSPLPNVLLTAIKSFQRISIYTLNLRLWDSAQIMHASIIKEEDDLEITREMRSLFTFEK